MGSNSMTPHEVQLANCYLHLRKRPYKSMPYIILLMNLVSPNSFIYYMNVFAISYSVMMAVGSCYHTEV